MRLREVKHSLGHEAFDVLDEELVQSIGIVPTFSSRLSCGMELSIHNVSLLPSLLPGYQFFQAINSSGKSFRDPSNHYIKAKAPFNLDLKIHEKHYIRT